jgi:TRAP transporter TAXI family solute receptor
MQGAETNVFNREGFMLRFTKTTLAVALTAAVAVPAAAQNYPDSFSVGTASQGGTYFVYGAGWANLVSEMTGVPSSSEVTDGPVQNASAVQFRDNDFAMVTMGPARSAMNGESPLAPGVMHDQIRAVFPMYQTGFHMVALASSGIESISDIPDGARVGVGPQGGTPGTYMPQILEMLGKDVEIRYGGASDLAGQLQDGLIDVFGFAAGLPIAAFSQIEASVDVNFIGFTEEEQAMLVDALPVSAFTIPADTYTSMDADQLSVSMWNFAIANAGVSDDMVYAVTKTVMENHDRMMNIHGASAQTLPENYVYNTFIPWHPGAVRWFEENGYDIPDDLEG